MTAAVLSKANKAHNSTASKQNSSQSDWLNTVLPIQSL